MKENITKIKSKQFAIEIVELYKYLNDERKEFILSKQVLRSGTSIGANISESECAVSTKDFINKLYIALKECNETLYWLELLEATNYINNEMFTNLYDKCFELRRILSSSTKTLREGVKEDE